MQVASNTFEYFELASTLPSTQATEVTTALPLSGMQAMLDLSRFLEHVPEPAALLLGPTGEIVPLPMEAYQVLVKVVEWPRCAPEKR